ncbi:MAG: tetratricopeptide repeat protein [Pseudomonadota bacterium]|nr:tetratricopeptide repeat protein [Pseudomonadota bacterium]
MLRIVWLTLLVCSPLSLPADSTSPSTVDLIERGDALKGKGELAAAMSKYQEAATRDPESAQAMFKLGGMQLVQQQYSDSIDSFQRSLMLDQRNANAFVGMAVAYLHMGSYRLAEAALDEAVRIDPSKKPEVEKVQGWIDERTAEAKGHGGTEGSETGGGRAANAGGH